MYENLTYEAIMQRMLDRVPANVDKRQGSLIFNAIAPAAAELKLMYIELDTIYNETFADTASRDYLIKRVAERGIAPGPATYAELKGVFNVDVPIGSRFTSTSYIFEAIEQISAGEYKMRSETLGAGPNTEIGSLVSITYIDGLISAELTEVLTPGEDEETTDSLRDRYFESFVSQQFGGNRTDYKARVNAITGVGGCKVTRTPAGGGTVGVVILSSNYGVPTPTLVSDVQTDLDPVASGGDGVGIAPIGHVVTVTGVTALTVNILMTISYAPGWDWPTLEPYVLDVIDAYLLELKQTWQNETNLIVRIVQIESRILNLAGVLDVSGTTLNGGTANLLLGVNEIPERGVVSG